MSGRKSHSKEDHTRVKPEVDWAEIDSVLLDMDGTLLDKQFDNYFWEELIPQRYAEVHGISPAEAKEKLMGLYKAQEKSLNWTDLDYWKRELDLDIHALTEEVAHLVALYPGAEDFLRFLKEDHKNTFLVTNSHHDTIRIKLNRAPISLYLTGTLCSHDIGVPKEDITFWKEGQRRLGFDKNRTLLIDDTEAVLEAARTFGIRHTILKARSTVLGPATYSDRFPSILSFHELILPGRHP